MNNTSLIKQETIDKYYSALDDLHKMLGYVSDISLSKFCEERGLSKNAATILSKGGIVKKVDSGWKWDTSVIPNHQMARKWIENCNETGLISLRKGRDERKVSPTPEEEKYFNFLVLLNDILKVTNTVSLARLCTKNKIATSMSTKLQEAKIIKKTGERASTRWEWIGEKPSIKMAKLLVENGKSVPKLNNPKPIGKEAIICDYSIIKLFFGLIRIKVNNHYIKATFT